MTYHDDEHRATERRICACGAPFLAHAFAPDDATCGECDAVDLADQDRRRRALADPTRWPRDHRRRRDRRRIECATCDGRGNDADGDVCGVCRGRGSHAPGVRL